MTDTESPAPDLLLALVNPVSGREDEFNHWYTDVHLPEVVALPGFVAAQRYEVPDELAAQLPYRYATVYEVEHAAEAMGRLFTAGLGSSDSIDTQMIFTALRPLGAPIVP